METGGYNSIPTAGAFATIAVRSQEAGTNAAASPGSNGCAARQSHPQSKLSSEADWGIVQERVRP
jgi:hypothetical protein